MAFLIPCYLQTLLKTLIPTFISSPNPFLLQVLGLFIACPKCCFLYQLLQPVPAPLNIFSRSHLGTCPSSGNAQNWAKQGKPLYQSLKGAARQVETHNYKSLTKIASNQFAPGVLAAVLLAAASWGCGDGRPSPGCCKFSTVFQSFSEVDSDSFGSLLLAFGEGQSLRVPYSIFGGHFGDQG